MVPYLPCPWRSLRDRVHRRWADYFDGQLKSRPTWLESDADLSSLLQIWGYIVALLLGVVIAPLSCFLYGVMGTGVSTNAISKMVSVCLRLFLVICIEY